jgi:hypothetical protein
MKIIIDTKNLKKGSDITLYLLSLLSGYPITNNTFEECRKMHYLEFERPYNKNEPFPAYASPTKTGASVVESALAELAGISKERLINLANKMRELFPAGKKPGYAYTWRDSTSCIADRLEKFFLKYGNYPDDKILQVTEEYVKSFNGNYTYMQLLKYFIWKNKVTGEQLVRGRIVGEVERQSQLAAYLQDTKENKINQDWEVGLR